MSGLEGIVAAETCLSHVDGKAGQLIVRGQRIEDLADAYCYENMVTFLWQDLVLPLEKGTAINTYLNERRCALFPHIHQSLKDIEVSTVEADIARTIAAIPVPNVKAANPAEHFRATALDLTAALPVGIAYAHRRQRGLAPVAPKPGQRTAEDYLLMLTGRQADPDLAKALDTYWVTVADHGMNASTFTARVVASTAASLPATIQAAYAALSGPLHGGAPGPVLDMLDGIDAAPSPTEWIETALSRKERLMGFGHRVYRTRDPRADILKNVVAALTAAGDSRLRHAAEMEQLIRRALQRHYPNRVLDTNVEYYTALLLERLSIPRSLFTPTFAIGRLCGWIAHTAEQQQTGRLIRPASHYTGAIPEPRSAA